MTCEYAIRGDYIALPPALPKKSVEHKSRERTLHGKYYRWTCCGTTVYTWMYPSPPTCPSCTPLPSPFPPCSVAQPAFCPPAFSLATVAQLIFDLSFNSVGLTFPDEIGGRRARAVISTRRDLFSLPSAPAPARLAGPSIGGESKYWLRVLWRVSLSF